MINHDLGNLNLLWFEKPGIFVWQPETRPTLATQKNIQLFCIPFLIEEHVNFYLWSFVSIIIHVFTILVNFPGNQTSWRFFLVLLHTSRKVSWWRITNLLQRNQIQTYPSFDDIYTTSKQIPTIQMSIWLKCTKETTMLVPKWPK